MRACSPRSFRGLLVVAAGLALLPAPARPAGQERLALEVDLPLPDQSVRLSVPLVEVRGRTGSAELFASDVVILLDLSANALRASGLDVDRDGRVGATRKFARQSDKRERFRTRPSRSWTTDGDDTVVRAELAAAGPLITALALRQNRVGLVTFADRARIRAWVGAPAYALAALAQVRPIEERAGANLSLALRRARRLLEAAPPAWGPERERALLLFSDGRTFFPSNEYRAREKALDDARALEEAKIGLYVFQLGDDGDPAFLAELAEAAAGRVVEVQNPALLMSDLPLPDLAARQLWIRNLTTGEPGRAIRTSPHGWFDGFAPLAPGENEIEVTAVLADGRRAAARRRVHYEAPEVETEADRRSAARLLVELRWRTDEVQRSLLRFPDAPPEARPAPRGEPRDQSRHQVLNTVRAKESP